MSLRRTAGYGCGYARRAASAVCHEHTTRDGGVKLYER
jgi:hypothetical protein